MGDPDPERPRVAQAFGRAGEEAAAAHYRRHGGRLLARNWRVPGGEIDLIVACRDGTIAFVEVKAGRHGEGLPERITPRKLRLLERAAALWLARNPDHAGRDMRIDVVLADATGRLRVLENVTAM